MKKHFMLLLNMLLTGKYQSIQTAKAVFFTILLCGIGSSAFANITVTPATGGTNICSNTAANGSAPAFTTLGVITMTEGANADFGNNPNNWTVTMSLTAPTGWQFNTAVTPVFGFTAGADITGISNINFIGSTTLSFRISGDGNMNIDVITITGVQVQATTTASAPANLYPTFFSMIPGLTSGSAGTNLGNLSLTPTAIIGGSTVCVSGTTSLSDATGGGTWSSSNTGIATVSAGGVVGAGMTGGTTTINYTVAGCTTSRVITVNTPPSNTFGGTPSVCTGQTTTLSNAVTGGAWTSGTTTVATVSSGGVVRGITAGTTIITYTIASCGTATVLVTVNQRPNIGGPATICSGNSITLSNDLAGGTWSSGTTTVATVNASTGNVVGASLAGTSVITYQITATGCSRTTNITVNKPPGVFTGNTSVCRGATTDLDNATPGGTWNSSTPAVATVNNAGTVSGVTVGTTIISYTTGASCPSATVAVTVKTQPAPLAGLSSVCINGTIPLSDATPGGTWMSNNGSIATVNGDMSGAGSVGGVGTGTANITYAMIPGGPQACYVTHSVTVNPRPQGITGINTVCTGTVTHLSDVTGSGTWSSGTPAVATVASNGTVAGLTAGTTVIAYTLATGCQRTETVTVNQSPNPIGGPMNVCEGQGVTLSDGTLGGTWSSNTTAVATIEQNTGDLEAIIPGTTVITYRDGVNGCVATATFTVNGVPSAISGIDSVCQASTATLSNTSPNGAWSSDNVAIATVDPVNGVVYGVSPGVANITYDFGATCSASASVTVKPLADTGVITGASSVCLGATTPLNNASPGGVWSSSDIAVATVSAGGVVGGVATGTVTISYTVTNDCGSLSAIHIMSVDQFVPDVSISPDANPSCIGTPVTFTATPDNGGASPSYQWRVNGVVSSTVNPYTYTPVNGDVVICRMISNAACVTTTVAFDTVTMVVNPNVTPSVTISSNIYGDTVCINTLTQFTAVSVNGGLTPSYQWFVNGSLAVTTANPLFSYIPDSMDVVKCVLTSSDVCAVPATDTSNLITMTVNTVQVPNVTITASANPSCENSPVTYTAHTLYGGLTPFIRWSQNSINVATGPTYTIIPGMGDQFYCVMRSTSTCRTTDSVFSNVIVQIVDTAIAPVVNVVATHTTIGVGVNDTLIAIVTPITITPTYQWFLNGVAIPGATASFYVAVHGAPGVNYYYCIVGNGNACNTTKISNLVTVNVGSVGVNQMATADYDLNLVPNPNTGVFTIEGTISSDDRDVTLQVTNVVGQVVYKETAPVQGSILNKQISLSRELTNGVYLLHVITNNGHKVIRFSLNR